MFLAHLARLVGEDRSVGAVAEPGQLRILARWDAGGVAAFLAKMNTTARSMGMVHTRYIDPSGYDLATRRTAADQVTLGDRAMQVPALA